MSRAFVYIQNELVGNLEQKEGSFIAFCYQNSWIKKGFPISHSLPLNGNFSLKQSHHFFSNLLPEANLRQLICNELKISPDNDWDLLVALGKESAGALVITDESENLWQKPDYEKLTKEKIDQLSRSKIILPQIITKQSVRLSLAGAQDKIAVYFDGKDYWLPLHGAVTNTLLKFDNEHYSQLPVNEVFLNHLAKAVGLPVVNSHLYLESKTPIAVFQRYDRYEDKNKQIKRLHQEDLCQALGLSGKTKYEKEGGPNFSQALAILPEISLFPIKDRMNLHCWQIFNLLCGNSDGHGKNISFVRKKENQKPQLAPFYDLVCTRVYKNLDRQMAMSFGGTFNPDLLDETRIDNWNREIQVSKNFLKREIQKMIRTIDRQLPSVEEEFIKQYNEHGIIEQIRLFIQRKINKTKKQFSFPF